MISSSVDLNASMSVVGSFWMNPTVSVTVISRPSGSSNLRVVESSVANSLSYASTSAFVSRLSRLDLPAFV